MPQGLWPDLARWEGPTANQGPAMSQQRGLVIHIAAGYYKGTIAWQKKPGSASSHFVVAGPRDLQYGVADGTTAQVIDCDVAAWTQRAGNGSWVSSENSGFLPDRLSAAQIESNAQLFARGHLEYGWKLQLAGNPNGYGLGYHSMGSNEGTCTWPGANWGHCECPGKNIIAQLPLIVKRAKEIVSGDPVPSLDAVDLAAIKNTIWYTTLAASGTPSESAGSINLQVWMEQKRQADQLKAIQEEQDRQADTLNAILEKLNAGGGGGGTPVVFPPYNITGTATPVQ